MDIINNIISETPTYVWIILLVLIILLIAFGIEENRDKISFWWLTTKYKLWGINRLAKDTGPQTNEGEFKGWYSSERQLCSDFYPYYINIKDVSDFDRARSYLKKADEIGRRHLPWFGWIGLIILLIAESLGFGQLVSSFFAATATARDQKWMGYVISIVIVMVLLGLTRLTGKQLYKNNKMLKIRHWFESSNGNEKKPLIPNKNVSFDNNEVDDDDPIYLQLASRIPDSSGGRYQPSYGITIGSIIIILAIAATSFWMREKTFETIQAKQSTFSTSSLTTVNNASSDIDVLLGKQTQVADEEAHKQIKEAEGVVATSAFIILTLIFVAAQAIGVCEGYFFGVCGAESKKAMEIFSEHTSRDDYITWYRACKLSIEHYVQSLLERLQIKTKRLTTDSNYELNISNRNFSNFDKLTRAQNTKEASPQNGKVESFSSGNNTKQINLGEIESRIRIEVEEQVRREKEEKIRAELLKAERLRHGLGDGL